MSTEQSKTEGVGACPECRQEGFHKLSCDSQSKAPQAAHDASIAPPSTEELESLLDFYKDQVERHRIAEGRALLDRDQLAHAAAERLRERDVRIRELEQGLKEIRDLVSNSPMAFHDVEGWECFLVEVEAWCDVCRRLLG